MIEEVSEGDVLVVKYRIIDTEVVRTVIGVVIDAHPSEIRLNVDSMSSDEVVVAADGRVYGRPNDGQLGGLEDIGYLEPVSFPDVLPQRSDV